MSRVLIIEDDREISDLISIHLKDMDLEVSQSYDGKDGLLKAIKFCREDDIINIEINTKKPGEVELRISDSGTGISQDDLPYIFERYYKNLDHEESTGLGLAIVKRIIDLHDSNIEVFSQPGKGTTFAFSLPMAVMA